MNAYLIPFDILQKFSLSEDGKDGLGKLADTRLVKSSGITLQSMMKVSRLWTDAEDLVTYQGFVKY